MQSYRGHTRGVSPKPPSPQARRKIDERGLVSQTVSMTVKSSAWSVSDADIDITNDVPSVENDGAVTRSGADRISPPVTRLNASEGNNPQLGGSTEARIGAAPVPLRMAHVERAASGAASVDFTVRVPATDGENVELLADGEASRDSSGATSDTLAASIPKEISKKCVNARVIMGSTGRKKSVYVDTAKVRSMGGTTSTWQYESTKTTQMELSIMYGTSTFVGGGGLANSTTNSAGSSFDGPKNKGIVHSLQWEFDELKYLCNNSSGNYDSGYRQWRPRKWTMGATSRTWTPFVCSPQNHITTTAKPFWRSNNKAVTSSGAFKIGGWLSASQKFTTGTSGRITYTKVSSSATAKVSYCGNNGGPSVADITIEGKPPSSGDPV